MFSQEHLLSSAGAEKHKAKSENVPAQSWGQDNPGGSVPQHSAGALFQGLGSLTGAGSRSCCLSLAVGQTHRAE